MNSRGKFIALEGGDGSGKGTHMAYLKEKLGFKVFIPTMEPGGTGLGLKIRELILTHQSFDMCFKTELLMFFADRAQHIEKVIAPALEAGHNVISDRFSLSTIAYQIYGREKTEYLDFCLALEQHIVGRYQPDLYVFLDVPPEKGIERMRIREESAGEAHGDRLDEEAIQFHRRVRNGYMIHLRDYSHFIANTDRPVERVKEEVLSVVSMYLKQ